MATIEKQETFLQNQQLIVRIKPVDTLGITGELFQTYVVKISFVKVYDPNDRARENKTLFERIICDKNYSGFAATLPDAVALVKRFIDRFESEFDRMTR